MKTTNEELRNMSAKIERLNRIIDSLQKDNAIMRKALRYIMSIDSVSASLLNYTQSILDRLERDE